ncbi:hypothetical protein AWJ20_3554 [Sugiyamaella lignohabitans]|uniref:Purine nucleoside permease n=1 Tax=Sugiyamaella lignohabitans TaxID=796027 RepID=A0A161HI46_9ASCO|nr:uncharacterized protein AWJ20_3554 [Sugiyamaella lignohabitans]ANB15910.1 hypothetical protein AWJ20_3554 [Sugiyamaella lignohabitans]
MKFSTGLLGLALASAAAAAPAPADSVTIQINGSSINVDIEENTPAPTDLPTYAASGVNVQSIMGKLAIFQPKAFIVSMFEPEQDVWLQPLNLTNNISIPGLSPLFPDVHCNLDFSICQVTTGEAEVNAASTISALVLSPLFDLTQTYFLIAGIAGISPHQGTLGQVSYAKYAVQVALEYEIDAREMPANWTTGYYSYGTTQPGQYPVNIYGTEVFELNENLRNRAIEVAKNVTLNDTETSQKFRALYGYAPANQPPTVKACDSATSDVYFFGDDLAESFGNLTLLLTNGSSNYCMTAQEDNASLEAFTRAAKFGFVDFARIVLMRTASDFDRPPPSLSANEVGFFNNADQGGFGPAVQNILLAGQPFIEDIIKNWDSVYKTNKKYAATNYIGDIFGTLGGTPDFGPDGAKNKGIAAPASIP